ncbi:MAG: hypothetical protein ACT4PW_12580 [Acidimicrobiia bacterium]
MSESLRRPAGRAEDGDGGREPERPEPPERSDLDRWCCFGGMFRLDDLPWDDLWPSQRSDEAGGAVPVYVERSADQTLDTAVAVAFDPARPPGWHRLIVVSGPPTAGKTRTLLERLVAGSRSAGIDPPVAWISRPGVGTRPLAEFVRDLGGTGGPAAGPDPGVPLVVVLDDIHFHLADAGDAVVLDDLHALTHDPHRHVVVVGTCLTAGLKLTPDTRLAHTVEPKTAIRLHANAVPLSASLNPAEMGGLWARHPELVGTRREIRHLSEKFAGVRRLTERVGAARLTFPLAAALMDAALDWWLIRPGRSVPLDKLGPFVERYQAQTTAQPFDPDDLDQAVAWATMRPGGRRALLYPNLPGQPSGYRLDDGVAGRLTRQRRLPVWLADLPAGVLEPADMLAIGTLAYLDSDGRGAAAWWGAAADLGAGDAMFNLALLAEEGSGTGDRAAEIEAWYRRAAGAGILDAVNRLASLLAAQGRVDGTDGAEPWWRRAAADGEVRAMANLGNLLASRDRDDDRAEAETWWRAAAGLGHADAMANLALLAAQRGRLDGEDGAETWWRAAAGLGHAGAMANLGVVAAQRGRLDGDDGAEAWWRNAARLGHAEAMFNLGRLMDDASSRTPEGRSWYRQAASLGHAGAMYNLGAVLRAAGQVEGDDGAEFWWRAAAGRGHADAAFGVGALCQQRGQIDGDDGAEFWWRAAAALGHAGAMFNLGLLRQYQCRIDGDDGAAQWWRDAAALGVEDAVAGLESLRPGDIEEDDAEVDVEP